MPPLIRAAVLFMVAALAFYSLGVWSAFIGKRLRPWHVGLFWAGVLSDTAGTDLMRRMAGGFHWSFHTATGAMALLLMFVHAIWGTLVLLNRGERSARAFHRASITVWTLWLIPFVTGMILGRHRPR
jgi:uncharacterized repeat protein (TIGR03987 family)